MHSIIMQMLDYSHFSKALASISVGQFLFLQVHVLFRMYRINATKKISIFFLRLPSIPYSSTDPYGCYRIVVVVVIVVG